jgi:hypothetical protein
VLVFITVWWAEEEAKGREIELEELVESHYFSRSTAFRKQQLFRQAFKSEGFQTPHDLAQLLSDRTKAPLHTARLAI